MPRTKQTADRLSLAHADAAAALVKKIKQDKRKEATLGGTTATKKPRRFSHIVLARRNIRRAQRDSCSAVFRRAPFTRLVRSILGEYMNDARVSEKAVEAVEVLVEDQMTKLFREARLIRMSAQTPGQLTKPRNITTNAKHLQLATSRWDETLEVGDIAKNTAEHRSNLGHLAYIGF